MCADTGNFAFVEYNDLICSHDRADPLCNNQHGRIGCFDFNALRSCASVLKSNAEKLSSKI